MEPFKTFSAIAAPIDWPNVDTDQIAPARFIRRPREDGYADILFHDLRFDASGEERSEFILNRSGFRDARILVADRNFGAGSSREQAVWALMDYGIRTVIGVSFGDIFANNATNQGLLLINGDAEVVARLRAGLHDAPGAELTIDLEAQSYTPPGGRPVPFAIDKMRRRKLLAGLDDIQLTLQHLETIARFETAYWTRKHWFTEAGPD